MILCEGHIEKHTFILMYGKAITIFKVIILQLKYINLKKKNTKKETHLPQCLLQHYLQYPEHESNLDIH